MISRSTINHGSPSFYGKGPQPLLWAGSQAAIGQTTVSCIPNCLNYYCDMLQDLQNLQMWPRAAQYNLAGRGLQTHGINYEVRYREISPALRSVSVISARYQQDTRHPLFASFEFLTAAYPSFPFFSSMTTKHYSPSKQRCPITHWRAIHQKNEILTLSRLLTVLTLRYSLLLAFWRLFFSLWLGNSRI